MRYEMMLPHQILHPAVSQPDLARLVIPDKNPQRRSRRMVCWLRVAEINTRVGRSGSPTFFAPAA